MCPSIHFHRGVPAPPLSRPGCRGHVMHETVRPPLRCAGSSRQQWPQTAAAASSSKQRRDTSTHRLERRLSYRNQICQCGLLWCFEWRGSLCSNGCAVLRSEPDRRLKMHSAASPMLILKICEIDASATFATQVPHRHYLCSHPFSVSKKGGALDFHT